VQVYIYQYLGVIVLARIVQRVNILHDNILIKFKPNLGIDFLSFHTKFIIFTDYHTYKLVLVACRDVINRAVLGGLQHYSVA
jgi:hypothetical protein